VREGGLTTNSHDSARSAYALMRPSSSRSADLVDAGRQCPRVDPEPASEPLGIEGLAAGFGETGTFFEEVGAFQVSLLRSSWPAMYFAWNSCCQVRKVSPQPRWCTRRRCWQRANKFLASGRFRPGSEHRGFVPARFSFLAPLQEGGDDVMTIFEDIGLHREIFADGALDG